MGLTGRLEDVELADVVKIIHLSKKSGVLILQREGQDGRIYFKDGLVHGAKSSTFNKSLSDHLLESKKITHNQYRYALETHRANPSRPLEEILLESGAIDTIELDRMVTRQISDIVRELHTWTKGSFQFVLETDSMTGPITPGEDVQYYKDGLKPQQLFTAEPRTDHVISDAEQDTSTYQASEEQRLALELREELAKGFDDVEIPQIKPEHDKSSPVTEQPVSIPESEERLIQPYTEHGTRHVVLVDDEALVRTMIHDHLQELGYSVSTSDSISEALRSVENIIAGNDSPVVLTDLLMPQSDRKGFLGGLELLKRIRTDYPELPVIMMTDQTDPEIRYQCFKYGVRNYLFKPDRNQNSFEAFNADMQMFASELGFCIRNAFRDLEMLGKHLTKPSESDELERKFGNLLKTGDEQLISTFQQQPDVERFKQIFYELKNLREASEIILLILRYAAECLERTIFFLVKDDGLFALGGFGVTSQRIPITRTLHNLQISLKQNTPFKSTVESQTTFQGQFPESTMNDILLKYIGRPAYNEFILVPILSQHMVTALLYGDNARKNQPIRNTDALQIFITQAEIAMENAFLQRKLKTSSN